MKAEEAEYVDHRALHAVISRAFQKLGLPPGEADLSAEVLVLADLRGVDSHGVQNSVRNIYVPQLRSGKINVSPNMRVVHETPSTATVDGHNGMGMVVGRYAMNLAMEKARQVGCGFVSVRNSNHYGMAGYYAMMALPHDMIGMSLTTARSSVVPLGGREPRLGTNPIAVAVPTMDEPPFVFDVATSTVAAQKVAIASISGRELPDGWIADREGRPSNDPKLPRDQRVLLPLGGGTREGGGHKGYGLAVIVDVFSGMLSGAGWSMDVEGYNCGHFFGAWRVDAFRPADEFKRDMDRMIRDLRATPLAAGFDRVYVAGEPDHEMEQERRAHGIPIHKDVLTYLRKLAGELGFEPGI
ncbi:MAG: Ldh family oxidoreductase [Dehalococcoidia bacterium]|nr:Ldh family oxidoreductase [Dehalococcoidia bacterium]